jgi:membrane fusion protein (multidrug efflux system)
MRRIAAALCLTILCAQSALAAPERPRVFVVFFQEWSAAIDETAQSVIKQAAELARANPRSPVKVTGFADPTGSKAANVLLSDLRAQRVVDFLLDGQVPANMLQRRGKGPVRYAGSSIESRRVEIAIQPK